MENPLPKGRMMAAFAVFLSLVAGGLFILAAKRHWWQSLPRPSATVTDSSLLTYRHLGLNPLGNEEAQSIPHSQYTIEVAAFHERQQAEAKVAALAKLGVAAFYTPLHAKGRVIYRVRIGLYGTADEAETSRRQLASQQAITARGVSKL